MLTIDKTRDEFLYQQVIDLICDNLESGALRPGDRLPSLRQMSQQMADEAEVAADTLMAMGMLVEALDKRQRRAREAFGKCFAKFAAAENRRLFKALFAQDPVQQVSG